MKFLITLTFMLFVSNVNASIIHYGSSGDIFLGIPGGGVETSSYRFDFFYDEIERSFSGGQFVSPIISGDIVFEMTEGYYDDEYYMTHMPDFWFYLAGTEIAAASSEMRVYGDGYTGLAREQDPFEYIDNAVFYLSMNLESFGYEFAEVNAESFQRVPEPSTISLFIIAVLGFMARARHMGTEVWKSMNR